MNQIRYRAYHQQDGVKPRMTYSGDNDQEFLKKYAVGYLMEKTRFGDKHNNNV